METNPILAYGAWLAEARPTWPKAAIEAAHRAFIDIIGVAVLGSSEEASRRVFAAVSGWGTGPSAAIGTGMRLAAPWAALVNGTAAHALDFDDNFDPGKSHATAVLAPAVLALAEQEQASGGACIDAYISGLQILGRVGQGVNPVHRTRGWHATGTVGAIGAAAACARLLGLNARQAGHALSIATSMAGGFMSQFGTMTKPVHAGLAARAGVVAASLARNGVDAGPATLDGPTGMNRLMVGPDYETLREALDRDPDEPALRFETERVGDPLLILSHGLRVKRFPNCGSAHRSMDGLLELMSRHGFAAGEVESVTVEAPESHLNNLMYTDPRSPLEAKFSLEFALALLLAEGACRLSHFAPGTVMRPDIRALYGRIRRRPVASLDSNIPTRVQVTLGDGRSFETSVQHAVGSRAKPFDRAQYWEKFAACIADALPPDRAAAVRTALEDLPNAPSITALMEPLLAPGQPVRC